MSLEALVCTVALALVAGAALARLKSMVRSAPLCERLGFATMFGASIGSAAEWWWPAAEVWHFDSLFILSCGLVAAHVIKSSLALLLAERRRASE